MPLNLYYSQDIARVLSSNLSIAIATSQASVLVGESLDRGYLFGVFSAYRSTAKAFGLSWPDILMSAICDVEEMDTVIDGLAELARQPLDQLVATIERRLFAVS